jgi:ELWxxDGT repeat protein
MFSITVFAGCIGENSSAEDKEKIKSLEVEINNLTVENVELSNNNLIIQQTLDAALIDLDNSNQNANNLTLAITSVESHRNNLSNALSETMYQLNRTQDQGLLAQLESQVTNLTLEIDEVNSEISNLNNQIISKQTESEQLMATIQALQSTIDGLTFDTRQRIGNCPMDNPGIELVGGFDDGSGPGIEDDGELWNDEVHFTLGECPGSYGRILNMSENSWGPQAISKMGDRLVFAGDDGIHSWEPWITDGTVEGTYMVKDVRPEECSENEDGEETCENYGSMTCQDFSGINRGSYCPELVAGNSKFFFTGYTDSPSLEMAEVFVSDGTEDGTYLIQDQWTHDYFSSNDWWEFFFVGPRDLHVIPSSGHHPDRLVYAGFWAHSGDVTGEEPYLTDGTTTVRMGNLVPEITEAGPYCCFDFLGSKPRDFTHLDNMIYFSAESNDNGRELYRYDLNGFGNNRLFLIGDIRPGTEGSEPEQLTPVGDNKIYFSAEVGPETGRELYFSRGSSANTNIVIDIWPGQNNSSNPQNLIPHGENIFFTANDGQNGTELWYSDSTLSGTHMIININMNGSSNPRNFILHEDILYFTAYNEQYGRELWKSDGTEMGTYMIMDIYAGQNSTFDWGAPVDFFGEQIIIHNDMVYFTANSQEYGYEIWHTDGTVQGTNILLDLNPGTNSSYPWWLTSFGDKLYFTAAEIDPYPTNGRQMYFYWDNPGPVIEI